MRQATAASRAFATPSATSSRRATRRTSRELDRARRRVVIELDHVSLAFDAPILEDVSFVAQTRRDDRHRRRVGHGKVARSLKLILRLLVPDTGRVLIDGEDITHLTFDEALEVRQKMGMVFQGAALFDSMTRVRERRVPAARAHATSTTTRSRRACARSSQFVDLEPDRVMEQLPSELSGGMNKRVGIARGMAEQPARSCSTTSRRRGSIR